MDELEYFGKSERLKPKWEEKEKGGRYRKEESIGQKRICLQIGDR